MKTLLTGGSGLLGSQMLKDNPELLAPSHQDFDVCNLELCATRLSVYRPDVLIHAAAFTSPPKCEENPIAALEVNVKGTANLVQVCAHMDIKLVYISTDYVFDGKNGLYNADDPINPVNKYAMSKAAGELAVRLIDRNLVVRTSFCENQFPYPKAFIDQYTSRDYVDVISPLIYEAATSKRTGVVHVGTERKSVYELAAKRKADVGELSVNDINFKVPIDTSFNYE
mgnify:CR=1 FL=1